MFLGEYQRSLDNKGRLFIPSKFRDNLEKNKVVLSKGFDEKCLFIYSALGWEEIVKKMNSLPLTQTKMQQFSRWIFKSAHEEDVDSQGRIKIDKELIDFAELGKDIVLVGVSARAEVWSKKLWEEYSMRAEKEFSGNNKAFEELGF